MNEEILSMHNVSKSFNGINAINNISLSVKSSEIVGLIGPNGSGKTTLFNLISGFILPDSGEINYLKKSIVGTPSQNIAKAGITRTFQDLRLIRRLSIVDNVSMAFKNRLGNSLIKLFTKWSSIRKQEHSFRQEVTRLLEKAGLDKTIDEIADELSYGQQKLLTLISCLAANGNLLLLDEPISGVAKNLTNNILDIILQLPTEGKSVIVIEHNIDAIIQICDRVVFMDAGKVICEGTPNEVRNNPEVLKAYLNRV
ncbi:MAG: ABC transporter ATP-binding protein [candidate division Zixibacteria bacterium]|nr:ABC transporter ATP-binding protein [candidate division Zixibacteria bacterium]